MRQLSAHDAAFLFADTTHSNANVSLIHIYNQSTAPGGQVRFKGVLARIERRLERMPLLRQRLQRVPMDLDYPYWVDDENFDLEYHVRHIALPKPGDWRQFCIQVSRLHARPLAPDRPLWEIHVIEGLDRFVDLPEGSFALVAKTHHAMIDVEGGSEITTLLHDAAPTVADDAPPAPWFPERPPGAASTLARGVVGTVAASLRLAGPIGRVLRHVAPAALTLAGDLLLPRPQASMPLTRFNAVVSPHRVFETRRFALADFESISGLVDGATVHDAVLATCGGALRRYLTRHGELPEGGLTALVPLLAKAEDAGAPGAARELLSWTRAALGTEIADPVQRLAAIRARAVVTDVVGRAVRARELTDPRRHMPAATLALTAKLLGGAAAGAGGHGALANCTITNLPGPAEPLYLCGARMTYFSAIMPIADGMGLAFAVTDYDGQLIVSPTSCRELMPDPAVFAQDLRDSFEELLAAARAAAGGRLRTARRRASGHGRRRSTSPSA